MANSTHIRRFCHAGFFEGIGRIFGAFSPAAGDPLVRERCRRSVQEAVWEEWQLIGSLLWDSIRRFQKDRLERKPHEQTEEAGQPAGSR
jgi:hypothetical protein